MSDYQTHVFTCTYTADVSGVCSALYELGGMSVLHDPSGCNSTYSTHDEPRWFEGDSLMFISGLDEMTAVLGDDNVLINDVAAAAADLKPRFITLFGASIPHIIAFDVRGTARLIEKKTGIPVLPVATDGLKSYVSGVGMALTAWIKRFADPAESPYKSSCPERPCLTGKDSETKENDRKIRINLMGVTPLDFSINDNVTKMRETFEKEGFEINCCAAMGETFESLQHIYRADVNVVVSSAGRRPARFMEKTAGIPRVEGLPVGQEQSARLAQAIRDTAADGRSRLAGGESSEEMDVKGQILVIGEEIFAKSLVSAINALPEEARYGRRACAMWPDVKEGIPEEPLIRKVNEAAAVIADPLYKVVLRNGKDTRFIGIPHEAYSGRIFRKDIPVFACGEFDVEALLKE